MKIQLFCSDCQSETGNGAYRDAINQTNVYKGHCPRGHRRLIIMQSLKHEILFEISLNAIRDGYYREAVTSFTASIERHYEFGLRAIYYKMGMSDNFDEMYKTIKKQSERQFGAFVSVFSLFIGTCPILLSQKMIELRNSVVHNGYLPTRQEAMNFARATHGIILANNKILRKHALAGVNAELVRQTTEFLSEAGNEYPRSGMVTTTKLNIIDDSPPDFDSLILSFGLNV